VMRELRKPKGGIWIEKGRGTVHHAACITKHDERIYVMRRRDP
jgi:hypothetical protein